MFVAPSKASLSCVQYPVSGKPRMRASGQWAGGPTENKESAGERREITNRPSWRMKVSHKIAQLSAVDREAQSVAGP